MRSSSGYGSGFSSTLSTTEKIAVFAPIATASVNTTTNAIAGALSRLRTAKRARCKGLSMASQMLLVAQRLRRRDPRRAPRGHPARGKHDDREHGESRAEHDRVAPGHAVKLRFRDPAKSE